MGAPELAIGSVSPSLDLMRAASQSDEFRFPFERGLNPLPTVTTDATTFVVVSLPKVADSSRPSPVPSPSRKRSTDRFSRAALRLAARRYGLPIRTHCTRTVAGPSTTTL